MNLAPLINLRDTLGPTYRKWAEHYNGCAVCQLDDWYHPEMGEGRFCMAGRTLFRIWVQATRITMPVLRVPQRVGRPALAEVNGHG